MAEIELFTIGFTQKSAQKFFGLLQGSGAKRILDVRLNNRSQLAGFAKKEDLQYFAKAICKLEYVHVPELAPTKDILDAYKKNGGDWRDYEARFLELMDQRSVERSIDRDLVNGACLLCSEDRPDHCHRLLVAKYLEQKWDAEFSLKHLY